MDRKSYETAFNLIISDLKELLSYVEPVNANTATYSHRIYELHLRVCTEFESVCKDMLVSKNYPKNPSKFRITDYKTLYDPKKFYKVCLLYWHPNFGVIEPFKDWEEGKNTLFWYQAYNNVKHNRNTNFPQANFLNLVYGIGALFTVLHLNCCISGSMSHAMRFEEQVQERAYLDYLHAHWEPGKIGSNRATKKQGPSTTSAIPPPNSSSEAPAKHA